MSTNRGSHTGGGSCTTLTRYTGDGSEAVGGVVVGGGGAGGGGYGGSWGGTSTVGSDGGGFVVAGEENGVEMSEALHSLEVRCDILDRRIESTRLYAFEFVLL